MITQIAIPESWGDWLGAYLARESASRPITTRKLRSYHLRRFAQAVGRPPGDVTPADILNHIDNDDWGATYRRSVLGSLRSFYRWARRAGLITFDPAEDSPSIRVELTLPRPASDAAVDAGMNARDPRVRLMTRLGNEAGLRCCEIVRVHSRDVMGRVGEYSLLVHGKGGKQRVVPIGDELARILLDADGWLFPGQIDGHLSAGYASKLISRAMAGAGTAHPLRHRAATAWLDSSDGNLRVVQELLGHASVATTQIYTQIQDRQKRAAVLNRAA
jgi:integrase